MKIGFKTACAGVLGAMLLSTTALAGSFVSVAMPDGAIDAAVLGINDKGDVAGSFTTDGANEIGFVGGIDGSYETFEFDSAPTQPRSLNNQGAIVGLYLPGGQLNEFVREKNGALTAITKDGTPLIGIAQGINASGAFVGDYFISPTSTPVRGGYKGKNAAWQSDVTLPFSAVRVAPRGINAKGDIAGWFIATPGEAAQGFVTKGGVTTVINYPDANLGVFPQGINDKGEISGQWTDMDGASHGFALASDLVSWTSFDAPGAVSTQAWQINNHGQIAVVGLGETSNSMFIYCPKKGGVCTGDKAKEKAGTEKSAKGKSGLKAPENVNNAADPDAASSDRRRHRK